LTQNGITKKTRPRNLSLLTVLVHAQANCLSHDYHAIGHALNEETYAEISLEAIELTKTVF
jgi:hypothetical protein